MVISASPKQLALNFLPDSLLAILKKIHYARIVRQISESDEPDLIVLRHLIEKGQCTADLGANIGVYSKYLSEYVGPSGRVISVEPVPLTYDILRSNLRKLGLTNVEAKNYAISDKEGEVTIQVPRYDSGGEDFYSAHIQAGEIGNSERCFVVPATTVDMVLSKFPVIHFIKCDVEGHELHCLRGAAHTIMASKPAWLIEISGDMDEEASSSYRTASILRSHGYEVFWYDRESLRIRRPGTKSVNYFFLTESHLECLRRKAFPVES